uniref:Uncharacterized protein n=1 Tax=Panagrolaimus davidi TaxID=227884 RepID=A0A914QS02_9BILA
MATKEASLKDNNFFASSSTQNDQYSNLNLNSNIHKTVESVQSKDIPIENGRKGIDDKCDDNFSQSKNTINLEQLNKKSSNALDHLAFYDSETEEDKKKVEKKNSAKSTVSLHIAAYENEAENSNLTELLSKNEHVSDKTKKLSVNPICKVPFEFSRQQENDVSKPEIMQFRASQRLLNPNERRNPQGIKWKEPQMQKLLDDFIDGKLPMNVEQFANHVNQISNTNTSLMTIRNRINDRQKERRAALQANSAATTTTASEPAVQPPPAVQNVEAPIAPRMDPPPPPASNDDNDDTVTYKQLYRAYLNFWNSLNNCVDDEYKIIPENGTRPTYREAKNLWVKILNFLVLPSNKKNFCRKL